ncbi:MAG: phytoene/squalene synthase family protein, partial [Chthoniobacterales bacterium]
MSPANKSILRAVSRSFYLSIRFLPARLCQPVALGYLLARSTDTVADTASIPVKTRIETLRRLSEIIQGETVVAGIADPGASRASYRAASPMPAITAADLLDAFVPLQTNPAERTLLQNLPGTLQWLDQMEPADRADIRSVLEKITGGQMLDLERFPDPAEIRALETADDLDEYTYLVAGCVGEFWTRLCFRHVDRFADLSEEKMLALGRAYGIGLQLINVLRDAGNDLRAGRCYFPAQELTAAGISPAQILRDPDKFQPIYRDWIDKAERGLEAGMEYSRAIRHRRVRAATVLPALIGMRTIALLRKAGPKALEQDIKIPRREVRGMMWSLVRTLASRKKIDALFT